MKQGKVLVTFFKSLTQYEQQKGTTEEDINTIILNVGVIEEYGNLSESFQTSFAALLINEYDLYKQQVETIKQQRLAGLEKAREVKANNNAAREDKEQLTGMELALAEALKKQKELKQSLLIKRQTKLQAEEAAQLRNTLQVDDSEYIVINGQRYKKAE